MTIKPFEWKDKPALIEYLFPVQKISVESFKEQEARQSKTLTTLGSYWKGRKPLILNKACILGSLLPATENRLKDLQIFEMLMGMDKTSLAKRLGRISPVEIAMGLGGLKTSDWFEVEPKGAKLPETTPFDVRNYTLNINEKGKEKKVVPYLYWREHITQKQMLELESKALPFSVYKKNVSDAKRPEELPDSLFDHVWPIVNEYLGTSATSFPELIEQMGIARFGHRPRVADVFSGSGQIPFEAARLGCDVYASDLNPIACMLTWGSINVIGGFSSRSELIKEQMNLLKRVQNEIDELGVETDGNGWFAKAFLYCVEVKCPETGWYVPLIPNLISKGHLVTAKLVPDCFNKRYNIEVEYKNNLTSNDENGGTIRSDVSGKESYVCHVVDGVEHKIKLSTIRKDNPDGSNGLRLWDKHDIVPLENDVFRERLYAILWADSKSNSRSSNQIFRAITNDDIKREEIITNYIRSHFAEWQLKGYLPDMVIEKGEETERLYKERGWTHWHHLFNPRQLLINGLIRKHLKANTSFVFTQVLNNNSKLSRWNSRSGVGQTASVFDNQALNTLFNYGCRGLSFLSSFLTTNYKEYSLGANIKINISSHPAHLIGTSNDIYITDPPYGDAVKYEEITEYFIAWLRKNPPPEFAHWTWDSRRALAVKGEDEGFRRGMIAAYSKMAEKMPDNGIQVLMFTHQSGSIWADMANIIWASGLQVTAAWYVVTETDSALRQGANVTGTVLLVLRKRNSHKEAFRDELGWEIEAAVKEQVESLTGLNKAVQAQESERLYNDADLQMAGYAAALKVLTAYSIIDGKNMVTEAEAPRIKGKKTFVDELIDFAVQTAVQFLVPVGFERAEWQKLSPVERFYLKMVEMEYQGNKTLDNYQNFAKAFKVRHFDQLMSDSSKANAARLKLSTEFKGSLMSGDAEIAGTPLRALLYGMYLLSKETEIEDVLFQINDNCSNYLANRNLLTKMADYIAEKRAALKSSKTFQPDVEASSARVLAEAIRNQRL